MARPFRMLTNYLFGEDGQTVPPLPEGLPAHLAQHLERHVGMLVEFQNTDYALLYLDRLGRFYERRGIDEAVFREMADLLAMRMSFNDPARVAQIVLNRAPHAETKLSSVSFPDGLYRPEVQEVVALFPHEQAQLIADGLAYVKMLRGRMRVRVASGRGLRTLKVFAIFRRIRPMSLRIRKESSAIERWLHMIDRALVKQPDAVAEVVRSAAIVQGNGAFYRLALANWALLINTIAKPVFDGEIRLPDLPAALKRARSAALEDSSGELLRKTLAEIRSATILTADGAAGRSKA